jgi:hypothetical protein
MYTRTQRRAGLPEPAVTLWSTKPSAARQAPPESALEALHAAFPAAMPAVDALFASLPSRQAIDSLEAALEEERRQFVDHTTTYYLLKEEEEKLIELHGFQKQMHFFDRRQIQRDQAAILARTELVEIARLTTQKTRPPLRACRRR